MVEFMLNDVSVQRALDLVTKTDTYTKVKEDYKNVYTEEIDFRKEALGKILAQEVIRQFKNTANNPVRAFLNAGLVQDIPQRFSYFGPMFRYERPQKGRLRQFKQFGVECIGISNSMADIEVISLGYEFLKKLDIIGKITLKINSLGDTDSRANYRKVLIEFFNFKS